MSLTRILLRLMLALILGLLCFTAYHNYQRSNPQYYWSRAKTALESKRYEAAEIHLRNLLKLAPRHGAGHLALAEVSLHRSGQSSFAAGGRPLDQLVRAASLLPGHVPTQQRTLSALLARNQLAAAIPFARRVLAAEPENADALFVVTWDAVRNNREQGDDYLQRLFSVSSNRAIRALAMGVHYYETKGELEVARQIADRAVRLVASTPPKDLLALVTAEDRQALPGLLLKTIQLAGEASTAAARAEQVIRSSQGLATQDPALGLELSKAGSLIVEDVRARFGEQLGADRLAAVDAELQKLYEQLDSEDQPSSWVSLQIAGRQFAKGEYAQALQTIEERRRQPAAEEAEPDLDDLALLELAARSHLMLGQIASAKTAIGELLAVDRSSGWGHLLAGSVAYSERRLQPALEHFLAARQRLGLVPMVAMALASTYAELGRWAEALPHLESLAAIMSSTDAEQRALAARLGLSGQRVAWLGLRACLELDEYEEAQRHRTALADSELEDRAEALVAVYQARRARDPQAAQQTLQAARQRHPDSLPLLQAVVALRMGTEAPAQVDEFLREEVQARPRSLEHQLYWAKWLAQRDQLPQALEVLERLSREYPDSTSPTELRVQLLLRRGRHEEALQSLATLDTAEARRLRHLLEAVVHLQARQLEAASEALEQLDAEHGAVMLLKGQVALGQGRFAEALDQLGESLDVSGLRAAAQLSVLQTVQQLARREGVEQARAALQPLLDAHPSDPLLWTTASDLDFRSGKIREALASVGRVEALRPDSPLAPYLEAVILARTGDQAGASDAVKVALRRDREHVPALVLASSLALREERFQEALRLAERALAASPSSWPADSLRVRSLIGLKQIAEAIQICEQAVARDPRLMLAWGLLAATQFKAGEPAAALDSCRRGRRATGDHPRLMLAELNILASLDRIEESEAVAQTLFEQQPRRALLIAQSYATSQRWVEARKWSEAALQLDGPEVQIAARIMLAQLLVGEDPQMKDQAKMAAAREHYEQVLKADAEHLVAGNNLAMIWLRHYQQPARASEIAERARGQRPPAALPVYFVDTLAECYREQPERLAEAQQLLEQALAAHPQHPTLLYQLGFVLAQRDRLNAAARALENALEVGLAGERKQTALRELERIQVQQSTPGQTSAPRR